jgi:predicted glutamine amidotransferase
LANTQPFTRSWRGRDWMFAHGGSLRQRLEVARERLFEPVGSTDSELVLMNDIADRRWRNVLEELFQEQGYMPWG